MLYVGAARESEWPETSDEPAADSISREASGAATESGSMDTGLRAESAESEIKF